MRIRLPSRPRAVGHTSASERATAFLAPNHDWVDRYYDRTTPSYRQRLLFR